jgi:ectoine hydroxylase-related dioxygenase (phytanoyl-CoA dioxygenase family)
MTGISLSPESLSSLAEQYALDGVVHVPQLLDAARIARLTDAVTSARLILTSAAAPNDPMRGREGAVAQASAAPTDSYPTAEYSIAPGRFTVRWLWRDDPEVRAFFTDSGVASVVAGIIGARKIQYWYDLTFFHDPDAGGEGTPWHHDIASFPCKGAQIPSLWIALCDVTEDMSPLRCVRGSHRNTSMFRPPIYVDPCASLPEGYVDMPDVDDLVRRGECELLTWETRAGDALVIHPYTLHGALANRSSRARVAFTTRWAGDDVAWNPDAFSMKVPGVDLAQVPRGQRPSGEYFPYVDLDVARKMPAE